MSGKQTRERCEDKYGRNSLPRCPKCPWKHHHTASCHFATHRGGRGHCELCGATACPLEEREVRIEGYRICLALKVPLDTASLIRLGLMEKPE